MTTGVHWIQVRAIGPTCFGKDSVRHPFLSVKHNSVKFMSLQKGLWPNHQSFVRKTISIHYYLKVNIETEELVRQNHWSPSETERQSAVKAIADYCNNYAVKTLETSREVLKKLKKQYKLVLVSNFYGNIETILKDFKLEYFESVIESAVVGVRKPDPEIYRMGVRATGFPAEETAVVGDSYGKDIIPAKAVGCKAIWMKGESWAPEKTDETLPDAIVENITQVADLFVRQ